QAGAAAGPPGMVAYLNLEAIRMLDADRQRLEGGTDHRLAWSVMARLGTANLQGRKSGDRRSRRGAGAFAQCRLLCSAKPVHSGYSCEPPCWLLLGEITPAGPYGSWVTWPVLRLGEFALSDAAI